MSTTEAKRTNNGAIEDLDVIIVGAGFAGLYLLDQLRGLGMTVQGPCQTKSGPIAARLPFGATRQNSKGGAGHGHDGAPLASAM